jgi:hypothetical protein
MCSVGGWWAYFMANHHRGERVVGALEVALWTQRRCQDNARSVFMKFSYRFNTPVGMIGADLVCGAPTAQLDCIARLLPRSPACRDCFDRVRSRRVWRQVRRIDRKGSTTWREVEGIPAACSIHLGCLIDQKAHLRALAGLHADCACVWPCAQ